MADLDRRAYDLLRLIDDHGPIGSIRLVDLMRRRGYSIEDRTIRLLLSEFDEAGLTRKVSGKGRALTDAGRAELERGDVEERLEAVRERIATLTSRVTYDPAEDTGELIAGTATVPREHLDAAFRTLARLSSCSLGPVIIEAAAVDREGGDEDDGTGIRLALPSSITLDGVLLARGIDARLVTAGLVEYRPPAATEDADADMDTGDNPSVPGTANAGEVVRYIDAISGEGSTMDVVSLLIEAGRTDVAAAVDGREGVLIVDNREIPLVRYDETRDLAVATREHLGGVLDFRRPRESGPFPGASPGWNFASLTYGGIAELGIALLAERGLLEDWETLSAPRPRSAFDPVEAVRAEWD